MAREPKMSVKATRKGISSNPDTELIVRGMAKESQGVPSPKSSSAVLRSTS